MRERDGGEENLAPVIPLFGGRPPSAPEVPTAAVADDSGERAHHAHTRAERTEWARAELARAELSARERHEAHDEPEVGPESDPDEARAQAEEALVRKLRAKQLSASEARTVLRQNDLDRDSIEDVIDEFEHRGYLDDRTLAGLLVTSGVERKGQGRVALARALAQRGIARDIIDEALAELPDDDDERALDYARSKASGMTRLEYDTALRRLLGQLARRGYGGSGAMTAARTALDEAGISRTAKRFAPSARAVRFTESD